MASKSDKGYGLIIPKNRGNTSTAAAPVKKAAASVFNADSSDEETEPTDWRKKSLIGQAKVKKQVINLLS